MSITHVIYTKFIHARDEFLDPMEAGRKRSRVELSDVLFAGDEGNYHACNDWKVNNESILY